jgi:hypothetical protein
MQKALQMQQQQLAAITSSPHQLAALQQQVSLGLCPLNFPYDTVCNYSGCSNRWLHMQALSRAQLTLLPDHWPAQLK